MEIYEWLQILIGAATCIILGFTLKSVLSYTRSSEDQTKAMIEQTEIGFRQTKAVIEQAKLIQRQMALSILPSFQLSIEKNDKGVTTIEIQNIGKGVGLNIATIVRFKDEDYNIELDYIPIIQPKGKYPIVSDQLSQDLRECDINSEITFIFADLLGNRYIQVNKIKRGIHGHGFVKPLIERQEMEQIDLGFF